jgi:lipid-A-disaccharide synthase
MRDQHYTIAIVAGEDSGDALGAELIKDLLSVYPHLEFIGVGGDKMVKAGLKLICSNQEFAIMGISEVVKKLPKLLKLRKKIVADIKASKPDLFIGIDAPDLNFPIEKKLKKQGIKIIHYVSPSIWAWRPKRAVKIAQLTDLVLTLFPFEPHYYEKVGGKAVFVGHPLAQNIAINLDKGKAKKDISLDVTKPVFAVLPGSRTNELKAHTEIFIKTAKELKKTNPDLQIISANTNQDKRDYIQKVAESNNLSIAMFNDATAVLKASNLALLASGTVALEAMLCKTPMVVGYKISPVTYGIVKTFNMMLLPYYSLPNVIKGDFMVAEVLQKDMTVTNLTQELVLLLDEEKQKQLIKEFATLHQSLLNPNKNAAQVMMEFLDE